MGLFSFLMALAQFWSLAQNVNTENSDVTLVFAGDAMQHIQQIEAAHKLSPEYDYSDYFTNVKRYVSSADLAVVNFEASLGGAPYTGYPTFSAPDSYLDALADAGFDFFLTANNHILDRRDKGLLRTIDQFEKRNLPYTGIYRNSAARDSLVAPIINVKGMKIAILNYTYGTNGIPVLGDVVVDYINRAKIKADVERARAKGAEIVIVAPHWGVEYVLLPGADQTALADFLADLGVDLIIGGHPHVIQPMELRHSDKYGKDIFICYSMGNYISTMRKTDTRGGVMVKVTLHRPRPGQPPVIAGASYRPVFVQWPGEGRRNYQLVAPEEVTGQWAPNARAFLQSAEKIFTRHNIGVHRDTTALRP